MTLDDYRRFYAEEIEAACGLRTPALVEAFARVERERFLGSGPWITKGPDGDMLGGPGRQTPDADPRRVYHNIVVALDPSRSLFNGQPGTIGGFIDQLALKPGDRVLHIGTATGYFTAIIGACVGPTGRVVGYEVDEELARRARETLGDPSWRRSLNLPEIDIRHGDASAIDGTFDAILVNAGTTHPLDVWLDALAPGGRIAVPITFAFGDAPIAKGVVALLTRSAAGTTLDARTIGFVAIYRAIGVRDESLNAKIGSALKTNPMAQIAAFRRDPHEESGECWLHTSSFCFRVEPRAATST